MLYDKRWDAKVETNETLRTLIAAREVIASPKNWCKYSRRQTTESGTAHCALGALDRVLNSFCDYRPEIVAALANALPDQMWERDGGGDRDRGKIVWFNNRNTHADVIALFDRAIDATRRA